MRYWFKSVAVAFMLFGMVGAGVAQAEQWTPKEIEIIMPHEVGSNQDGVTRALGKVWQKYLPDTTFVFVNKGQAGGRLGLDYFVDSPADGTSLIAMNVQTIAIMYAQQKPEYDWFKVVDMVNTYAIDPGAMIVNTDSEYKSFMDLVNKAKTRDVLAGVSRFASPDSLVLYQIMEKMGCKFNVVPLGSGSKVRAALLGKHVDFIVRRAADVATSGGRLRAVSMGMPKRMLPEIVGDIPTTSEEVGEKLLSVGSYRAIAFKKGFKEKYPDRYELLVSTFTKAKNDPEFVAEALRQGMPLTEDTSVADLDEMSKTLMDLYIKYASYFRNE